MRHSAFNRRGALSALTLFGALVMAVPGHAALVLEAGGGSLVTAQIIVSSGDDTIIGGVSGDATLIASGITTITSSANGVAGRQRFSFAGGSPGGTFTLSTTPNNGAFSGDGFARQYTDNTFTTTSITDDDDGPGAYPEFRKNDIATINADGTIHLEFADFGDNDALIFGFDILDVTNATRNFDFFSFTGLTPGDLLSVQLLSDGSTFGFFDGRIRLFDSAGTLLANVDADNSSGPNPYFESASVFAPANGIIIVEAGHSGNNDRAGGTYNLRAISSANAVPIPGSLSLVGLGLLLLLGVSKRRQPCASSVRI